MLSLRNLLPQKLALILIVSALAVAAGFIIYNDADKFVIPTAIGETHKKFVESEDFQYLDRANRAFINLVKHTSPSVVQITTLREQTVERTNQRYQIIPPEGFDTEEFRRFLDRFDLDPRNFEESNPNNQIRPPTMQAVGIGSGVIVSDDGYILTNNHVIDKADEIIITLSNGKQYDAELIGTDPAGTEVNGTDLAVLKIDEKGLSALPFGDSDVLEVGEWVVAIGTPFNLSQTVTRGVVSAKDRFRPYIRYSNFIQTDAPINQGNSGGALINIRGELVGINTLIATNGYAAGNVGIGFAIPSNIASELLPQLIEHGKVVRGWLGIRMNVVNHDMAEKLNLGEPRGAIVVAVGKNSPAEKAGILNGDVVLEFNGKTIKDTSHLMQVVAAAGVGTKVNLKVLREGKEMLLTVKLAKRTEEALASFESSEQSVISQVTLSGMHVQNLTPELARRYGHQDETGVIVVEVEQRSPAARSGIVPGYLIKEIDYTEIQTIDDFKKIVDKLKNSNEKLALIYFKDLRNRANYETLRIQSDDR